MKNENEFICGGGKSMKILLRLLFCSTISFLLLLAGCGSNNSTKTTELEPTIHQSVNDLDGVTMSFKGETISSIGGTILLKNDTNKEYIYGQSFLLEKKINEFWYQVPITTKNYGFDAIGYELNASDFKEWTVDWDHIYGKLENGEYRMVKDILDMREQGDYDTYYLTVEFTIE